MKRVLIAGATILMLTAAVASAQNTTRRSSSSSMAAPAKRIDLIPMAGYAWTMSMDVVGGGTAGELDFSDKAYYGGALDVTVSPPGAMKEAQVRLMYRRSDGQVQYRSRSFTNSLSTDAAIEYWQIGGVTGISRGKSLPFATVSLGATRLITKDQTVGASAIQGQDLWKFSMIFGLGVKVYNSPKIGIMLQANWPITFTDTWGGVSVGTGGAGLAIGGTGISQLDLGGGLIIRL